MIGVHVHRVRNDDLSGAKRFEQRDQIRYGVFGKSQQDVDIYVMISAYWEPLRFTVEEQTGDRRAWKRAIDTSLESPLDIAEPRSELALGTPDYLVGPRSVVVLVR